jgi:predicted nucleic acid-binding protein
MTVFIDASAFYAVLDSAVVEHEPARERWDALLASDESLVTSNYVIVETGALVQRRLGLAAVEMFFRAMLPAVEVLWLDAALHEVAVTLLLRTAQRRLSLVDCASFTVMQAHNLETAFAFDRHFVERGLTVVP